MMTVTRCIRVLVAAILVPTTAMAHPGASIDSIAQGALHPLGGVDHLLAMLSVGALAARAGGRSIWAMPAVFLTSMIAGAVAGTNELRLPLAEPVIALSVVYFGAAILMQHSLPPTTSLVLISLFALFHGHAHGTELTGNSSHVFYGIGLVATTALLHGIGLSMSLLAARMHTSATNSGQDHRAIKRRYASMSGVKSFASATVTITQLLAQHDLSGSSLPCDHDRDREGKQALLMVASR